jgi:superfamily II DNA helicase RecQ
MPAALPRQLRDFYHDEAAQFTCIEQARAMVKVLARKEHLLVVLPTGCGKSLLFQLPAFAERGMMTVVILPLVSLTKDMKKRCSESGINWTVWNGKCMSVWAYCREFYNRT